LHGTIRLRSQSARSARRAGRRPDRSPLSRTSSSSAFTVVAVYRQEREHRHSAARFIRVEVGVVSGKAERIGRGERRQVSRSPRRATVTSASQGGLESGFHRAGQSGRHVRELNRCGWHRQPRASTRSVLRARRHRFTSRAAGARCRYFLAARASRFERALGGWVVRRQQNASVRLDGEDGIAGSRCNGQPCLFGRVALDRAADLAQYGQP